MNKFNIGYEKFYLEFIERTLVKLNIGIKDINTYHIDYIINVGYSYIFYFLRKFAMRGI